MPLSLNEILPEEDYRFHLTLRRGELAEFFGSPDPVVLGERGRWLATPGERFLDAEPVSSEAIAEVEALASGWPGVDLRLEVGSLAERVRVLGRSLEADFIVLTPDEAGIFRLRAGAVCFPSSWSLEEKMGKTLDEIHGHVPGLNPAMGGAIGQFLGRLRPGAPYERANWGLAATAELNLHPSLGRPRLVAPFDPANTWLRIEDQVFAALPASCGILFGIKLRILPLSVVLTDPRLRSGFRRAMATMSEPLAAYKGLTAIRPEILLLP